MTIAWSTPVNTEPPLVAVVIGEQAYSLKTILKTKEFAVNVPTKKLLKETEYCGSVSGKKVDKFKIAGFTQIKAQKIKAPLIRECVAHLECRLYKKYKFADAYLLVARVVAAQVDAGLFDDHLRVDKLEAKTLHHLGGKYFTVPAGVIML